MSFSVCHRHKQRSACLGFSLLEVLLGMALASLLLLAASYLVQMVTQRANWWYAASEMVMLRQAVAESIDTLSSQVCAPGLAYGGTDHWRWRMWQAGRCQVYDLRFNKDKKQVQKRRLGGRYSGFVDAIWNLEVSYGVAEQGRCAPGRWLPQVSAENAQQTVLLRLQYEVGIAEAVVQYSAPTLDSTTGSNSRGLTETTSMLVRLPCAVKAMEGTE